MQRRPQPIPQRGVGGALLLGVLAAATWGAEPARALLRHRHPVASLVAKERGQAGASDSASAFAAEALAERSFWNADYCGLEQELLQLQDAGKQAIMLDGEVLAPHPSSAAAALLSPVKPAVLAAGGGENKNSTSSDSASSAGSASSSPRKLSAAAAAPLAPLAPLALGHGGAKKSGGRTVGVAGVVNQAALGSMLKMLKGLYEGGKERVMKLNKEEREQKEKYAKREAEHKAALARIEQQFANHSLTAEGHDRALKGEARMFSKWEKARERHHKRYLHMLKIQHEGMAKEKKMIDMYEATLAGKSDERAKVKKELGPSLGKDAQGSPPEEVAVVLLRQKFARSVVQFCADALAEIKQDRQDLASESYSEM